MGQQISKIWDYVFENLFCQKTKLVYDFIVPEYRCQFEKYLPSPELIRAQIPNPCGWGTGMEDSMINAGVLLSAAIKAFEIEKDPKYLSYIRDIFEGMKTCASVSESEGFLARSVSPVDGKTHYSNSSRDQYTHWIDSAAMYYESGLATEEDKRFIEKALCAFARRARKNVTTENHWDLLREDGKNGAVTYMWNVAPHEMMRLPMFYLAAWKIGGDESFKNDYLKFRNEALASSESIDFASYSRSFAINQMQLSLDFAYRYDDDAAFKERCFVLMKRAASYGLELAVRLSEENTTEENKAKMNFKAKPWDQTPAWFSGFVSGYAYYCPMHTKSLEAYAPKGAWLIREIGDALMVYIKAPDACERERAMEALQRMLYAFDLKEHTTDAPLYLLLAYYALVK